MYIQTCLKGIAGESYPGLGDGITWAAAQAIITSGKGLISRWWGAKGTISPGEVQTVLTTLNLERHLNEYATYGATSPFISLAAGYVGVNWAKKANTAYSAKDVALRFATKSWKRAGAVFYCWTPVGIEKAVEIASVSEAVRDTLVYQHWFQHLRQGEIAAKVGIPANQISRVEWRDAAVSKTTFTHSLDNPDYVPPNPLLNYREWF